MGCTCFFTKGTGGLYVFHEGKGKDSMGGGAGGKYTLRCSCLGGFFLAKSSMTLFGDEVLDS